jgi:hypothetical protein
MALGAMLTANAVLARLTSLISQCGSLGFKAILPSGGSLTHPQAVPTASLRSRGDRVILPGPSEKLA